MDIIQLPENLDLTEYMDHETDNPLPVRYRLSSAIYHAGKTLMSGHYGAGVTSGHGQRGGFQNKAAREESASPAQKKSSKTKVASASEAASAPSQRPDNLQFFCNDTEITDWIRLAAVSNKLTLNPVNFSDAMNTRSDWDPYTLWYVREPADALVSVVPVAAHVAPADGADTIGGRLRKRKRGE